MIIKRLQYLHDNTANEEDRIALSEAIKALANLERNDRLVTVKNRLDNGEHYSEATSELLYPEHEWVPCNFRKILESLSSDDDEDYTEYRIHNSILDKPLHILEDDGMGYGAFNSYAFTSYTGVDKNNDKEAQIWI